MDKYLILEALKSYKCFKSDSEFADYLEVSESELKTWKRKHSYDTSKVAPKFPEVEESWLITGEGEILKRDVVQASFGNNNISNSSIVINKNEAIEKLIEVIQHKDQQIDKLIDILCKQN